MVPHGEPVFVFWQKRDHGFFFFLLLLYSNVDCTRFNVVVKMNAILCIIAASHSPFHPIFVFPSSVCFSLNSVKEKKNITEQLSFFRIVVLNHLRAKQISNRQCIVCVTEGYSQYKIYMRYGHRISVMHFRLRCEMIFMRVELPKLSLYLGQYVVNRPNNLFYFLSFSSRSLNIHVSKCLH